MIIRQPSLKIDIEEGKAIYLLFQISKKEISITSYRTRLVYLIMCNLITFK